MKVQASLYLAPKRPVRFTAKAITLKVDNLVIRYDPDQPIDAGLAQRVAELTGGQTLEDLYQAQLAQEALQAKQPPAQRSGWAWLTSILQQLKVH